MVSQLSLSAAPNQTIRTTIPGNKKSLMLTLTMSYNQPAGYWTMGIYDTTTGNPYVLGIPLLCGYDILGQYQHLGIGSAYVVNVGDPTIETPDDTNIADNFILVWEL